MKSATANKKTGRPPALTADAKTLKIVEGLGKIQATTRECAAVLGVSHQTFLTFMGNHPQVGEVLEKGKEEGKTSLRRTQFALAKKNAAMAIFLGKNYLDQTDRQDITSSVTVDVTVTDARSKLEHLIDRQLAARPDQGGAGKSH
jgi:carbamate kinase